MSLPGIGHNGGPRIEGIYRRRIPKVYKPIFDARHAGRAVRYIGLHGGRGSGKSHFFAEEIVIAMLDRPTRVVCLREIQKDLRLSSKLLIADKIQSMGVGWQFDIKDTTIRGPHGSLCVFQGMQNHTADSIKSLEGFDIAWFEEAHSASKKSLTLLRPTVRKPGSQIWASWNPTDPKNAIDAFMRSPEARDDPEIICLEVNWRDNPYFPDELRKEMERDRKRADDGLYQHVWEGAYANASNASVFKNWRVEDFEAPEGTIFYFGADWGFAQDPSVLIRCFIVGRTIFIDYEAYAVGCDIDKTPFLFAGCADREIREKNPQGYAALTQTNREMWTGVPKVKDFAIRADSARPETISYMQKHGFPRMVPAVKGAKSVEEGVRFLQSYDIVIHPRCVRTAEEFRYYAYKIDEKTEEVTSVLADADNHVIDAARYALEEVRRRMTASTEPLRI